MRNRRAYADSEDLYADSEGAVLSVPFLSADKIFGYYRLYE